MSSPLSSTEYYQEAQYTIPHYHYPEHLENLIRHDMASSVIEHISSGLHQDWRSSSYQVPDSSLISTNISALIPTTDIKTQPRLPLSTGTFRNERRLNPTAPTFGVSHSYAGAPTNTNYDNNQKQLGSEYLSYLSSSPRYLAPQNQFDLRNLREYDTGVTDSNNQSQFLFDGRNYSYEQLKDSHFELPINLNGTHYTAPPVYNTSGFLIPPVQYFPQQKESCHDLSYANYCLAGSERSINIDLSSQNYLDELFEGEHRSNRVGNAFRSISELNLINPASSSDDSIDSFSSTEYDCGERNNDSNEAKIKDQKDTKYVERKKKDPSFTLFWGREATSNPYSPTRREIDEYKSIKSYHTPNNKSRKDSYTLSPERKEHLNLEKTPFVTQNIPEKEFFSEQRHNTSYKPRSRRGKTISTLIPSDDPLYKETSRAFSFTDFDSRRPPPRMNLGLPTTKGIHVETLSPSSKTDIFKTGENSLKLTSSLNLITSQIQSSPPEKAKNLIPCGQSPALFTLTARGTRKPNIEDILHSLPFVEYCRLAKEDHFGVIKIKNVRIVE